MPEVRKHANDCPALPRSSSCTVPAGVGKTGGGGAPGGRVRGMRSLPAPWLGREQGAAGDAAWRQPGAGDGPPAASGQARTHASKQGAASQTSKQQGAKRAGARSQLTLEPRVPVLPSNGAAQAPQRRPVEVHAAHLPTHAAVLGDRRLQNRTPHSFYKPTWSPITGRQSLAAITGCGRLPPRPVKRRAGYLHFRVGQELIIQLGPVAVRLRAAPAADPLAEMRRQMDEMRSQLDKLSKGG